MDTPGPMVLVTQLSQRIYRRATDEVLGMSLKEFITLSALRNGGGTMTQQALGEALRVDANMLVVLLNSLEDAGQVERRRDPDDRRRHIVAITVPGRRALARAERGMESIEDEVLERLEADDRAQLRALLLRALEDAPAARESETAPAGTR